MHCRSGPRPRLPVSQPRMKVERAVCASLRGALIPANGTIETVPVGSLRAPADRRATTLTGLLRSAGTRYTGGVRASERPRYNPTQGPPKKRGRSSLSLGPSGEGPRGQMSAHHGSLRLFARPPARPPALFAPILARFLIDARMCARVRVPTYTLPTWAHARVRHSSRPVHAHGYCVSFVGIFGGGRLPWSYIESARLSRVLGNAFLPSFCTRDDSSSILSCKIVPRK